MTAKKLPLELLKLQTKLPFLNQILMKVSGVRSYITTSY
jgi:hypothetical protein